MARQSIITSIFSGITIGCALSAISTVLHECIFNADTFTGHTVTYRCLLCDLTGKVNPRTLGRNLSRVSFFPPYACSTDPAAKHIQINAYITAIYE